MLRNLVKYETKATGRILIPLYAALLVFAIINKLFMNNNSFSVDSSTLVGISAMISIFAYVATMVTVFVVTFYAIIQRFYKNLLGDEGYLMNTLPVAPWQNISSKLIVAVLWCIVSSIVAILSVIILAFNYSTFNPNFFKELIDVLNYAYTQYGINIYLVGFEFIIAALLEMCVGILMIYSSISIGHSFTKRKILGSLSVFLVFNIIMDTIISIFAINFSNYYHKFIISWNISSIAQFHIISFSILLISLLFFICYFAITTYTIKNKLNLE